MFSIIKRILRLSGKYRSRVIVGLIFNALKSCCAAFVFFAVLLVMLNIEHLTGTVILQAFGIIVLSVLGRFLFQYLSDVFMSASGYEIFREKRLEIGNQLKRAPMGYFTENNLGTVQTVLTTTISDLEGNCMLVAAISSKVDAKAKLPTHYLLKAESGLELPSLVLLEQLRTIDKKRLETYIGRLEEKHIRRIDHALAVSVGLIEEVPENLIMCLCPACANNFYGTGSYYLILSISVDR